MKRIYALLTLVMLTIAAAGQTLNVRVGSVVYQFPADQTGEMTYSGGTTLTVMGKTFALAEITSMTVDNTSVTDGAVGVTYNGTSATVRVAGNVAQYLTPTVSGAHVSIVQSESLASEVTYTLDGTSAAKGAVRQADLETVFSRRTTELYLHGAPAERVIDPVSLGHLGTPIGTPPNATAVKFLAEAGTEVTFGDWAMRMIPFVAIMLLVAWVLLQLFFPFKAKQIKLEIPENTRKTDWKTIVVWVTFIGTILLWATEKLTGINSNIVALIPLGVLTATGIFTKEDIKEINWSVLWLVAGGFALGTCLQGTGLAKVLINAIPFGSMSVILVLIVAGVVCYFLSNFISNSATAALLIPILIVVAEGMANPEAANNAEFVSLGGTQAMISFIAVCASIAMLFPISTPPNAIASSTGLVETKDMAKVGIIIGAVGFVLGYFWLTKLFPFA